MKKDPEYTEYGGSELHPDRDTTTISEPVPVPGALSLRHTRIGGDGGLGLPSMLCTGLRVSVCGLRIRTPSQHRNDKNDGTRSLLTPDRGTVTLCECG